MKICCDTLCPYSKMSDIDKLSCNHDFCTGIKDVSNEEYAMIELVRLGQEMGLYEEVKE